MKKNWVALVVAGCLMLTAMNVVAGEYEVVSYEELPEINVEDFTLHSGVVFTDSLAEIYEKEKEAGFNPEYGEDRDLVRTERSIVAGIDNSRVIFQEDSDHNVYSATYSFNQIDGVSFDSHNEDFNTITDMLISKYGNPIYYDNCGEPILLLEYNGDAFVTGFAYYAFLEQLMSADELDLPRYNQWLIETEDAYILLDHYIDAEWLSSTSNWNYMHTLKYIKVDKETIDSILKENLNKQEQRGNAANDL